MRNLASAALVQHLYTGAGPGPAADRRVLAAATVYLAVTVAGLLVAPVLTGQPGRRRARSLTVGILGASLVACTGLTLRLHAALPEVGTGWRCVAFVAHVAAAAVWLGGVVHLALFVAPDRRLGLLAAGIRRFGRFAVGCGAVLAGTGTVLYAVHHLPLADLTDTVFGVLVTGKAMLLPVAAGLGLIHSRATTPAMLRRRPTALRLEAATLGAALGLGSALVAVDGPLPVVRFLGAGLASVATDAGPTNVFVVSLGAKRAALELLSDESAAVRDRTTGRTSQVQPGQVIAVALADGVARLELTNGQRPVRADVPAAAAVAIHTPDVDADDRIEWTAYQLGHVLARQRQSAGTACAVPDVGAEGLEMGRLIRAAGVRRLSAVADQTARSRELVAGVRDAGVAIVGSGGHAQVALVATSRAGAPAALRQVARHGSTRAQALYLAPWLLDGGVLSQSSSMRLPPITVATATDPISPIADRFRIALGSAAPGVEPTVAALRGYLASVDPAAVAEPMQLYAASPVGFLPGVVDDGHAHDGQGWFANGTLVPTSTRRATRPATCPPAAV